MQSVWQRIFGSSKNIMMLAAVIFAIVARVGLHLEMELIVSVLTLVAIAIGARAAEDVAKAKASAPVAPAVSAPSIGQLVVEAGKAVESDGPGAPFPTGIPGPGQRDS